MIRKISYILMSFFFFTACEKEENSSSKDDYNRGLILKNYADNIIVPAVNQFSSDIATLETNFNSFKSATTEDNFNTLKESWVKAYKTWQHVEAYDIGKAESLFYWVKINTYPTKSNEIESNISNGNYDLKSNSNTYSRGLPALDYMFYGVGNNESSILSFYQSDDSEEYLNYISDLIDNIVYYTDQIVEDWRVNKDSFIASTGNTANSSLNKITNDFIFFNEKKIRTGKIGIPAGVYSSTIKPTFVEAYYAKNLSKTLANEAVLASKNLFIGKAFNSEKIGESFKTYLEYLNNLNGNENLANDILSQYTKIEEKLDNLSDNIEDDINNNKTKVLETFDEMQVIIGLLKVDMLQQFSVSTDYTDSDGD